MPTKEGTIKKILSLTRQLHNEYKLPLILAIYSKQGILSYGSKSLVKKLTETLKYEDDNDEDSWKNTFHHDQEDILNGERLDEEMEPYLQVQGNNLPDRLPAPINLMVYNEIHPIVSREILKWYWRQGGKYKTVHYGDPEFKADFWPDSWQWESIRKNFGDIKKTDYEGPADMNMTEFFRMVLKEIFENYYEINPSNYVSKNFTEAKKKNRERYRGIHRQPVVEPQVVLDEVEANDVHNNSNDSQEDDRINFNFEDRAPEYRNSRQENYVINDGEDTNDEADNVSDNEQQNIANNSNISDVIGADLYNEIEDALGPLADDITDIVSPPSPIISRKRIRTESETPGRSSDALHVFRKTPSQLNHNIPRKEPRIRLEISNKASPMRNVGNC